MYNIHMHFFNKTRLIEFLLIGIVFGITEDIIAILLATDHKLNLEIFFIATAVAVPFAFISEIIVDHPDFWKKIMRKKK